jgi:hypothetical protein
MSRHAVFNYRLWLALKLMNEKVARDYFFGDISEKDAIEWMECNKNRKKGS